MLGFMRKHARSAFIKTVFWMIIIVFVFWGVGVMVSGGNRVNVAASVDGEPITAQEYTRAYENLHRVYQQIYRDNFGPQLLAQLNLHQRALDELVMDLLMRREAARLGLTVTDDEVREAILNMPNFRSDNRFDRGRYLATLRASRLSPTDFEESQRKSLLVAKLEGLLTDGITVGERELRDSFGLEHEKLRVAYVRLPYSKHRDGVSVDDAEIAAHYEQNQESFRDPERARLTHVAYDPDAFRARLPVSDQSIAEYYAAHESDYETPEKVRVREILFALAADADDAAKAEVRAKAEGVLAAAKGGADFVALARTHSGEAASEGADSGLIERSSLDAAVDEATASLEPGQVGDLAETPRGLAIVKLEERQARTVRPLAEVRDEIVRAMQEAGADQAARDALAADLARARDGTALEELAAAHDATATTSPPLARGESVPGVPPAKSAALLGTALGLEPGAVEELAGTDAPYYLVKVVEKTPSTIKPLEDVRERIGQLLRNRKAKEAAHRDAEALLAAAREAGPGGLATAARAQQLAVEEAGPFGRSEAVEKLSTIPKADLFALTSDAPLAPRVFDLPDASVVIALVERVPADDSAFAEKRDTLRDSALARTRSRVLEAYRDMLRQRADIEINPDVVTAART